MSKTVWIKRGIGWVVGLGAGRIINQVIENNTNPEKPLDKFSQKAGGYILGAMVGDAAASYAVNLFEGVMDSFKKGLQVNHDSTIVESTAEVVQDDFPNKS